MTQKSLSERSEFTGARRHASRAGVSVWRLTKDWVAHYVTGTLAMAVCILIFVIGLTLLARMWPLLVTYSLTDLLTGQVWLPTQGKFGFATFMIGSVAVTLLALSIVLVPALFTGIFLAEYTSTRMRALFKPLLDLLAGIPSVVYGLWAVLFIVPLIRDDVGPWVERTLGDMLPLFSRTNPSGYGLLAAGLVLAAMVFPFIVAITEEVLRSIPRELREALLALGATRWEVTKCVVFRQGLPGVLAAFVLGISRAFGETLAIMMVAGNVPQIPHSLFDPVYPLPALIANNYGEMLSIPLYESALMGAAFLLLLVVLFFNIVARLVIIRVKGGQ